VSSKLKFLTLLLIGLTPVFSHGQEEYDFELTSYLFNTPPAKSASFDLNNDGLDDILLLSRKKLDVILNSGLNFSVSNSYITIDDKFKIFRTNDPNNYYYGTNSFTATDFATGDVNGDGILDVVVANYGEPSYLNQYSVPYRYGSPGGVAVLIGGGDGTFNLLQSYQLNNMDQHPHTVKLGDVDNDLDLDVLVILEGSPDVIIFKNDGSGVLSENSRTNIDGPSDFMLSDIENDGDLDILATYKREFRVYVANGSGFYVLSSTYTNFSSPLISTWDRLRSPEMSMSMVTGTTISSLP
jgi:hypothetical protein